LDPRLKRHPLILACTNYARKLLESRLELALLGAFEDGEQAIATAGAGAGEPAVSLLHTAPPAFAAYEPVRRFSSGAEPSAARAAAALLWPPRWPLFAPAGPVVRKTAHEKTRELAVATVSAWVSSPEVNAPVMGAGSSAFNLQGFNNNMKFSKTTPVVAVEVLNRVGRAFFGWEASAARPKKVFSHAGFTYSALKNRYSVEMLEIMFS
jgi:hypothetical protein